MRRLAGALAVAALAAGCGDGAQPSVLRVTVGSQVATAVYVGHARVVTVAHVLRDGLAVEVDRRPARLLRRDRRLDLALLEVPGLDGDPADIAADGSEGQIRVLRDGRTRAIHVTVRRRVTAAVRSPHGVADRPALELIADVLPGDSGAPVTDGDGRVLGVVFARADGGGTAWAVDAAALTRLLR